MEIPAICLIAAGFTTRSLFGEIGAAREAVLLVSYNLVFLLAAISIAVPRHSFRLDTLAGSAGNAVALSRPVRNTAVPPGHACT